MKYLGEMLNYHRNVSCCRTSSAARGQVHASAPSGQSRIDANRLIDAADQDEKHARFSSGHRNTWATLVRSRWRYRSCVGSDTPTDGKPMRKLSNASLQATQPAQERLQAEAVELRNAQQPRAKELIGGWLRNEG